MSRPLALAIVVITLTNAAVAGAQTEERRAPASAAPTFLGDTGFWFVPTAEILPRGRVAVSGYRASVDRTEQFATITQVAGSIAVGIADRVEVFGSIRPRTRIDALALQRQLTPDERVRLGRGFPMDYPFIGAASRSGMGDLFAGAKVKLRSESPGLPLAFALRSIVKLPGAMEMHSVANQLPFASMVESLGTGRADVMADAVVSSTVSQWAEVAGFFGVIVRGQPDDMRLSNGFRLGVGAALPTRSALRVSVELLGEVYWDGAITYTAPPSLSVCYFQPQYCLVGSSPVRNPVDAFAGIDYRHRSGFFVGAGVGFSPFVKTPADFGISTIGSFGGAHLQVRFGYHPGTAQT